MMYGTPNLFNTTGFTGVVRALRFRFEKDGDEVTWDYNEQGPSVVFHLYTHSEEKAKEFNTAVQDLYAKFAREQSLPARGDANVVRPDAPLHAWTAFRLHKNKLTASDRAALVRQAASLPKGSPERRQILASLTRRAYDTSPPVDAGTMRGAKKWEVELRGAVLATPVGPGRDALIAQAEKDIGYASFLFRRNRGLVSFYDGLSKRLDDLRETVDD